MIENLSNDEVERLIKDALRYRWLREPYNGGWGSNDLYLTDLDEEIDLELERLYDSIAGLQLLRRHN